MMVKFLQPGDAVFETEIVAVGENEIEGRPQLVLLLADPDGGEELLGIVLTRELAEQLTERFGPHPLVERFFGQGKGLQ
jgi:hypothetical protein